MGNVGKVNIAVEPVAAGAVGYENGGGVAVAIVGRLYRFNSSLKIDGSGGAIVRAIDDGRRVTGRAALLGCRWVSTP